MRQIATVCCREQSCMSRVAAGRPARHRTRSWSGSRRSMSRARHSPAPARSPSRPAVVCHHGPQWEASSAFDQAHVAGARALAGLFGSEFDALTFAQQLEYGAADRAAMEKVLDAAFVANEPETFVDEEPRNSPG